MAPKQDKKQKQDQTKIKKQNQKFNDMHEKLQELIEDIENGKIDKAAIKAFARKFPLALNIRDSNSGDTLLHCLLNARVRDRDIYKTLLDFGASPCIPDSDGYTAAHLAAHYNLDPECVIFPMLLADCNVYYYGAAQAPTLWDIAIDGCHPKAVAALCKYGAVIYKYGEIEDAFYKIVRQGYPRAKETIRAFLNNFKKERNWNNHEVVPGSTVIYDQHMMNIDEMDDTRMYFYNSRELAKNGSIKTLYNTNLSPPKLDKSPITRRPWKTDSSHIKEYPTMTSSEMISGIQDLLNS